MLFSRPSQDATDLVKQVRTHSARFHYVRLLAEILSDQLASIVQCSRTVLVQRANHELGTIDLLEGATRALGTGAKMFHRFAVVSGRHQIVEQDSVGYLACKLHHLHSSRADVNWNLLGQTVTVNDVDLDVFDLNELAF